MNKIELNEKWKGDTKNGEISHFELGYRNGAYDLTEALYNRALELYMNKLSRNPMGFESISWDNAQLIAFEEAMNGEIEPPK